MLVHCDTPSSPINIGGPELVSVRKVAQLFGEHYGIEPRFRGAETDCLAVNCDAAASLLGNPTVPINTMIRWVAEWVKNRKPTHGKPSKFEVRSGVF